jgi:hypothetical protein
MTRKLTEDERMLTPEQRNLPDDQKALLLRRLLADHTTKAFDYLLMWKLDEWGRDYPVDILEFNKHTQKWDSATYLAACTQMAFSIMTCARMCSDQKFYDRFVEWLVSVMLSKQKYDVVMSSRKLADFMREAMKDEAEHKLAA